MALQGDMDEPLLIDARGHHCPVPTLRLQKALEKLVPGGTVRLLADDPMAKIDVPHFCQEAGHQLVSTETEQRTLIFLVAKACCRKIPLPGLATR